MSGLGMIVIPERMISWFGYPTQDAIVYGITGSVYLAFGILSILGLRSPLKFTPVLLLQLLYKTIWFVRIIIPIFIAGQFPQQALMLVVIFPSYITGDLIAIPFPYVFSKDVG